jgi:hypothetical protein
MCCVYWAKIRLTLGGLAGGQKEILETTMVFFLKPLLACK